MKLFLSQLRECLSKRCVHITAWVMLILIGVNFAMTAANVWGMDVSDLVRPEEQIFLSDLSPLIVFFLQLLPFLVAVPAGFLYISDYDSNILVFVRARIGCKRYIITKFLAAFFAAFLTFFLPLLLELFLYHVAFPGEAAGDVYNYGLFSEIYLERIQNYGFIELYRISPVIYNIFMYIIWSFAASTLSVFTMAVSSFGCQLKVLLFLPDYLILYVSVLMAQGGKFGFAVHYGSYFVLYESSEKKMGAFLILAAFLFLLSFVLFYFTQRRDWLK